MIERRFSAGAAIEGRRLMGTVIRYGDVARIRGRPERFEPGSLRAVDDVRITVQHDRGRLIARQSQAGGGVELIERGDRVDLSAVIPESVAGNDALAGVQSGLYKGLSMEFEALREDVRGGARVIEDAALHAVSLVDTPAYPESQVEVRADEDEFIRAEIPLDKTVQCECHRGVCNQVRFTADSFDDAIYGGDETLAYAGDAGRPLASKKRGSLHIEKSDDNSRLIVHIARAAAMTTAGRALASDAAAVRIIARPMFDQASSEFAEAAGVATYSRVALRGILIKATAADAGWPEIEINPESRQAGRSKAPRMGARAVTPERPISAWRL